VYFLDEKKSAISFYKDWLTNKIALNSLHHTYKAYNEKKKDICLLLIIMGRVFQLSKHD
jgi:hypothetical protein